jgi:hypothetical protein
MRHDTEVVEGGDTADLAMTMQLEPPNMMVGRPATEVPAELRAGTEVDDRPTLARDKVDPQDLLDRVARESANEIETIAREKLSARDLAIGDSTAPGLRAVTTDVHDAQRVATNIPVSTAPHSLPPPQDDKAATASGPTPACPQCEAPMVWVDEHLRFYCKSCRMYF